MDVPFKGEPSLRVPKSIPVKVELKMSFFKPRFKGLSESKWFAGVHITSSAQKLEASLIGVDGYAAGDGVVLKKSVSFDLPSEISLTYQELRDSLFIRNTTGGAVVASTRGKSNEEKAQKSVSAKGGSVHVESSRSLYRALDLCQMIVGIEEEAISELLSGEDVQPEQLVAVAVNEPRLATSISQNGFSSVSSCAIGDSALLAGRLGVNVVDSFNLKEPGAENARSYLLFPYWILASESDRDVLFIDLGETARWFYLPSGVKNDDSWKKALYREVSPCGSLLDKFAFEATKGAAKVDFGGKLSVQGRCSKELLDFWRKNSFIGSSKERDVHEEPFYSRYSTELYLESLKQFPQQLSSIDALCTAVHGIADAILESLRECESSFSESFDVVIAGASKHNGLLFNRISKSLAPRIPKSLSDLGYVEDSFDSVAVATLGVLFASQIPSVFPELHGVPHPQILGRVAPGTPEAWKRFVEMGNGVR